MNSARLLPLALLATIALASCEKEEVASPNDVPLLESRWQLARVDDTPVAATSTTGPNNAYLEFVDLGKCTVGLGPCNNFSGRFSIGSNGRALSIAPQIATRVACPAQELETHYLTNLTLTTRYDISGNELRLYDATTATPRLVFQRAGK